MMKLNSNTKVKIISLLSAIALWMYVIAIVDPEDTRIIEDIPVTLTNTERMDAKDLVVYQDEPLTCSMYISGKLSNVKSITKDDIQVYGEISDPIEGKNVVYLKANMSDRVSHEFSSSTIIVNLEKKIYKDIPVKIDVPKEYANTVESAVPEKESIEISGPREQVSRVSYLYGEINPEGKKDNYKENVKLTAIDKDGKEVEDIELGSKYVSVQVKMLSSKKVSINPVFNSDASGINYSFDENSIEIKGKSDKISEIESINTEEIDLEKLKNDGSLKVALNIPEGIISEKKDVTVFVNKESITEETININKSDIQLRNNQQNISISDFNLPDEIEVVVSRYENVNKLTAEDIELYIDLSNYDENTKEYKIEYSVNLDVESVEIKPDVAVLT